MIFFVQLSCLVPHNQKASNTLYCLIANYMNIYPAALLALSRPCIPEWRSNLADQRERPR